MELAHPSWHGVTYQQRYSPGPQPLSGSSWKRVTEAAQMF
eukprot:CAMPEP_0115056272 /NCGR_PEP_ID=MMETSP0227-20121206/5099_1 /TAXON_ID=89957 /ORGANISM="Polarella glacialis, Strain CCMP 1383" /LENGTH=39 /DNA_ID= /DNA_START= /DNA_END= /DNA_ORIENTATION=